MLNAMPNDVLRNSLLDPVERINIKKSGFCDKIIIQEDLMEIEILNNENKQEWNEFCEKSNAAWFRHTTYWQDYILNCRFDSNSKNLSFMVKQNSEIIAVVPLISQYIYGDEKNNEFANYDTPIPYLAIKNDNNSISKENVINFVNEKIEELAMENKIKRAVFFIDPLIRKDYLNNFKEFNLLKFCFSTDVKTTNIIDMEDDIDSILRKMRKGHKADIKSVLKSNDFRVDIFNKDNFTEDKLQIFKEIHMVDAGRQTRTDRSWECMGEWIKNNHAILLLVWINSLSKYCAGGFFILYKERGYYGSYATLDSYLLGHKIGHLTQWSAIEYLKQNNFEKYEVGYNYYKANFKDTPNLKEMEISKFKRGFGGNEVLHLTFKKDYA